jgi:hypothetical protein
MDTTRTWLAMLLVASLAGPAKSAPPDAVRAFGGPPLGAKWGRLPPHLRREPNCYVTRKFVDCEFAAQGGVYYLVYGDEITRKEVRRTEGVTGWPLGLTGHETPTVLKQKLRARYRLRFVADVSDTDGILVSAPTAPDPNSNSLDFRFSKTGRLTKVTLFRETPEV